MCLLLLQNRSCRQRVSIKSSPAAKNVLVTGRGQVYHYLVGTAVKIMNS